MRALIFILSTILIFVAIILVLKNKSGKFLGLQLKQKWVIGLVFIELALLILAILDYHKNVSSDIANDLLWHNMISYYRGVLPVAGLMEVADFNLNKVFSTGLLMFVGALLSDYLILKVVSIIKSWTEKSE